MKQARKVKEALRRRIAVWDDMLSDGIRGTTTKIAKSPPQGNGMAYHKPGSQNLRKGKSARSANR